MKPLQKFRRDCELVNYSGTKFQMGIERTIRLLDNSSIAKAIGVDQLSDGVSCVASHYPGKP